MRYLTKYGPDISPQRAAVATAAALIVAAFVGTAADRRAPLLVQDIEVKTPIVLPDHNFYGLWKVTIYLPCRGTATRWLQSVSNPDWYLPLNSIDLDLDLMAKDLPKFVIYPVTPFALPLSAPPGLMTYHNVTRFRCNSIGHLAFPVTVIFPVVTFTVAPILSP